VARAGQPAHARPGHHGRQHPARTHDGLVHPKPPKPPTHA
jgi:hypothetical protein